MNPNVVRIYMTKDCELVLVNHSNQDTPILEVILFINGEVYGEPIVGVTWQYLIELILQVSRGELSEFMDYYGDEDINVRLN